MQAELCHLLAVLGESCGEWGTELEVESSSLRSGLHCLKLVCESRGILENYIQGEL